MGPGMILLLTENQWILVNTKINIIELSIINILFAKKKKKNPLYFLHFFPPPSDSLGYNAMLFHQTFFEICNLFGVQRKCHSHLSDF